MRAGRWAARGLLFGVLVAGVAFAGDPEGEHGTVRAGNRVLRWLGVEVYETQAATYGVQATLGVAPLSEATVVYPEPDPGSLPPLLEPDALGRLTRALYWSGGQLLETRLEYDALGRTTRQVVSLPEPR